MKKIIERRQLTQKWLNCELDTCNMLSFSSIFNLFQAMSIPYKERFSDHYRVKVKRSTSLDGIQTLNRSSIAIISWYTYTITNTGLPGHRHHTNTYIQPGNRGRGWWLRDCSYCTRLIQIPRWFMSRSTLRSVTSQFFPHVNACEDWLGTYHKLTAVSIFMYKPSITYYYCFPFLILLSL